MGQKAENLYFGKQSGLMDQTASSVGGAVAINFADPADPVVRSVAVDLNALGYALCIVDSGASHAALTGEYDSIPKEMRAVAAFFGKTCCGRWTRPRCSPSCPSCAPICRPLWRPCSTALMWKALWPRPWRVPTAPSPAPTRVLRNKIA